jgi:hypothetical protein
MTPLRIYIAGPMTGKPDLNRAAFVNAANELKQLGHTPVNPFDLHPADVTWQQAMRADIAALTQCDCILMLEGWESSRGATLEHYIAVTLGIAVMTSTYGGFV